MKVSDIISDDNERKVATIINHLKKKKKANPVKSRTDMLRRTPDDAYGTGHSPGNDTSGGTLV